MILGREPAVLISVVTAVLTLLVSFGLPLDAHQEAAIVGVLVVLGGLVTRQRVTPWHPPDGEL